MYTLEKRGKERVSMSRLRKLLKNIVFLSMEGEWVDIIIFPVSVT